MSDYFNSLFSDLPDNDGFKQIITGKTKKKEEDKFNFNAFAQPDPNMIQIEQDATYVDLPPVMSIAEKENQRLLEKEQEIAKVGKAIQDRIRTGRTADVARTPFNTLMAGLETAAMPAALGIEAVKGMTGSKGGADFKQSLPSFLGNKYFPGQYEGQDLSITGAVSEDFQKNYPITSAIADFGLSIAAGSAASKGAKLYDAVEGLKGMGSFPGQFARSSMSASKSNLSKYNKLVGSKNLYNQFKSEIDWAKWNPDTPKQKVLMDDYLEVEKRTKADGTWMKNPDGTPFVGSSPTAKELSDAGVNMTPKEAVKAQFVQQKSKAFKEAFNNPVLDKKGNIQINYHGSSSAFDFFDPLKFYSGKYGKGIYTSPDKEKILKTYADPSKNRSKKIKQITNPNTKSSDNLYSLYINSKNTGNLDELNEAGKYYGNIKNYGKTKDDFLSLEEWKKENADFLKANTFLKNDNDIKQFIRTNNQTVKETFEPVLPQYDFLQILDRKIPEQVTPYSNLMKSALGNVGTFDMANPNIYKGLAGAAATGALLSDEEVRNNPETALAAGMFFTPFRFGKKKVSKNVPEFTSDDLQEIAKEFGNIRTNQLNTFSKIQETSDIKTLSKAYDESNERIVKDLNKVFDYDVQLGKNPEIDNLRTEIRKLNKEKKNILSYDEEIEKRVKLYVDRWAKGIKIGTGAPIKRDLTSLEKMQYKSFLKKREYTKSDHNRYVKELEKKEKKALKNLNAKEKEILKKDGLPEDYLSNRIKRFNELDSKGEIYINEDEYYGVKPSISKFLGEPTVDYTSKKITSDAKERFKKDYINKYSKESPELKLGNYSFGSKKELVDQDKLKALEYIMNLNFKYGGIVKKPFFKYGGMVNTDPPPTDPPSKNPWVPSVTTSTARGGKLKGDNLRGKTLNQRLYESITPIGYSMSHAFKEFKAGKRLPFKWDGEETTFEDFDKMDRWRDPETGELGWYGKYVKEASDQHWRKYLFPEEKEFEHFYPSKYKPSTNTGEDVEYMQFEYDDDIFDEAAEYGMFNAKVGTNKQVTDSGAGGFTLKDYTLSKGKDERGDYISYWDKVDFAPSLMGMKIPVEKFVGKPYDFYGRMYYTKDEEGKVKRVFPKDPKKKEFSMKDFLSPENILKSTSKPQIDNLRTK